MVISPCIGDNQHNRKMAEPGYRFDSEYSDSKTLLTWENYHILLLVPIIGWIKPAYTFNSENPVIMSLGKIINVLLLVLRIFYCL